MLRQKGIHCPPCRSVGGRGLATSFAYRFYSNFQVCTKFRAWHLLHVSYRQAELVDALLLGLATRTSVQWRLKVCVLVLRSLVSVTYRVRRAAASKKHTSDTADEATHLAPFTTVDVATGDEADPVQVSTAHRPCYMWLLDFSLALKLRGKPPQHNV